MKLNIKNIFRRILKFNKIKEIVPESSADYNAINAIQALYFCDVKNKKVLVVGCNRGKDCSYFIKAGAEKVLGLDVLEDTGSEYEHKQVVYLRESAENMVSLEDNYFDLVYCFATLEHVPDIKSAFSEMKRVCKKGGVIYTVAAPLWNSSYGHHKKDIFDGFPWIHLCLDKNGIKKWFMENKSQIMPELIESIDEHINYMLDINNFNKRKSKEYFEICNNLGMEIIVNKVERDPSDVITSEIRNKLIPKYSEDELLGFVHRFVGKKI